jgi:hypothetical protein
MAQKFVTKRILVYCFGPQTTMNRFLTASPCLRWLLGVPFLVVSLAIFETVGVVAVDTTLSNYGLEYGLVVRSPRS